MRRNLTTLLSSKGWLRRLTHGNLGLVALVSLRILVFEVFRDMVMSVVSDSGIAWIPVVGVIGLVKYWIFQM